jgi:hypothetical protein
MQQQSFTPRARFDKATGRWVIESTTQRGVGHQVDPQRGICTCTAGKYGKACKHLKFARTLESWRVQAV